MAFFLLVVVAVVVVVAVISVVHSLELGVRCRTDGDWALHATLGIGLSIVLFVGLSLGDQSVVEQVSQLFEVAIDEPVLRS